MRLHPDSPPFTGGVYDAWPAKESEAIAFARAEEFAIDAWLDYVKRKETPSG